jgi:hypothetical protein
MHRSIASLNVTTIAESGSPPCCPVPARPRRPRADRRHSHCPRATIEAGVDSVHALTDVSAGLRLGALLQRAHLLPVPGGS